MKTLIKTKLLEDKYIEIRDYEMGSDLKIILCSTKNYKSCFHVREPYMKLTVAQQKEGTVVNTQQSKFPPYSYYKMYKFLWKPTAEVKDKNIAGKTLEEVPIEGTNYTNTIRIK